MARKRNFVSIEDTTKELDESLEEIFKDGRFQEMLNVMSKFRNYSFNNNLMIAGQRPDATMVNGFRGWQELGRFVKKGEKGIAILAPSMRRVDVKKIDQKTKEPVLNVDGKAVTEKKSVITGFSRVNVFDVSQTGGKEIPSVRDFVNRDLQEDKGISALYKDFKDKINQDGTYSVAEDETEQGTGGYFRPSTNEIVVSSTENGNDSEKFRVLVHEYAHAKLHNLEGEYKDVERGHKEAQAESVAYVVSNYYGMETDDISIGYIASWAKDIEVARQALSEIQSVSNEMVDTLDDLQLDKIHEFYQQNEKAYDNVIEDINSNFDIDIAELNKNKPDVQFEIIQKDRGNVLSARLEHSERVDKFQFRLNNNRIIPLDDFTKDGNYSLLNKEIVNGKNKTTESYKEVGDFSVHKIGEGNYVIQDSNSNVFSDQHKSKELAESHLGRLEISQMLHYQSFTNTQKGKMNDEIQQRLEVVKDILNYKVGEYLTKNTNKEFYPKGNGGTTIGWELMKRPDIKDLDGLQKYVNDIKNLTGNKRLRNAMEEAHVKEPSQRPKYEASQELELS